MIADHDILFDGQLYESGQEIWDLGSLICTDVDGGKRHYQGLSSDVSKLPHYVASGSTCFMLDNNSMYRFHKPTDTWYKIA